jgi:hypothetical protein
MSMMKDKIYCNIFNYYNIPLTFIASNAPKIKINIPDVRLIFPINSGVNLSRNLIEI